MAEPKATLPAAPANPQPFSFTPAPTSPHFDVVELLPPQAAERLRKLRVRRDDAFAVTVPHAELQALTVERQQAEQRLKQLRAHPHDFGFKLLETDARVVAQQKLVDKLSGDLKRLNERSEARSAAWNAAGRVLTNVEDWMKNARPHSTILQDVETSLPKLLKGESITDAIARLQRRVRELRADQHRVSSSPFPSSFAKARMREMVQQLGQRGAPDPTNLLEHDAAIVWPTMRTQVQIFNGPPEAIGYGETFDVVGLIAWALKDTLTKRLDALIDENADDGAALSHTDRELRTSEIMADLAAVELDEGALVWAAMEQKLPVEFRSDINPVAVLQVALVTVPRAIDGPTTSPFAYDIVGGGGRR